MYKMLRSRVVTIPNGATVHWGSEAHITALRATWAVLTPAARASVRQTFPDAAALIDACPTCEYVAGTHVSWCPTYAARVQRLMHAEGIAEWEARLLADQGIDVVR